MSDKVPAYKDIPKGIVLTWAAAKCWLDYEFDPGYGAPECNSIYVWTNFNVYFIVQYDGSTSMHSIPRQPTNIIPEMPGG